MAEVLVALGIQDRLDSATLKAVTIDGVELTPTSVLKEFRWSLESYKHKCQWFGWADNMAQAFEWASPVPTAGQWFHCYAISIPV